MATRTDYIDSLDIPESDKELLYDFEGMPWEDIYPERCKSEEAKRIAYRIMQCARHRDEYDCGMD